jgi:hypothetical protein
MSGAKGRFIAQVDEVEGLGPMTKVSGHDGPQLKYPEKDGPAADRKPKRVVKVVKPKVTIHRSR